MRKTLRCEELFSSSCGASSTTITLVSSFEREVVIPNGTKNRTYRILLFITALNAHDFERYGFSLVGSFERDVEAGPVVCTARRHRRIKQSSAGVRINNLDLRRTSCLEFVSRYVAFKVVIRIALHGDELRDTDAVQICTNLEQ